MVEVYQPTAQEYDMALTVTQFVLNPDVPPEQRKDFIKFYLMFSKTTATSYIEPEDIYRFKLRFRRIAMLYNRGEFEYANELIAEFLMELQLGRSIKGFWTLYGQHGVQRTEQIEKTFAQMQQNTTGERVKGLFGRRKKYKPPVEETGVQM